MKILAVASRSWATCGFIAVFAVNRGNDAVFDDSVHSTRSSIIENCLCALLFAATPNLFIF